jgi:hypothetical protein
VSVPSSSTQDSLGLTSTLSFRLRRRTRSNLWQRRKDAEHEHVWVEEDFDDGTTRRTCEECGYQMEIELL